MCYWLRLHFQFQENFKKISTTQTAEVWKKIQTFWTRTAGMNSCYRQPEQVSTNISDQESNDQESNDQETRRPANQETSCQETDNQETSWPRDQETKRQADQETRRLANHDQETKEFRKTAILHQKVKFFTILIYQLSL